MRYQDWDVLLFPNPEEGDTASTHVPLREFRTACYTVQSNATGAATSTGKFRRPMILYTDGQGSSLTNSSVLTPLLTCFVPSLLRHAPFQISVHSWTRRDFLFRPVTECMIPQQMWQIKVIVDGVCARYGCNFSEVKKSPANTANEMEQYRVISFGHRLAQSHWCINCGPTGWRSAATAIPTFPQGGYAAKSLGRI